MPIMTNEKKISAIASRLKATREALGLEQSEFADRAKIARNTYNQWEKGRGRPQLEGAMKLCEAYNLTLDWIYYGSLDGLPLNLAISLGAPVSQSSTR